MLSMEQLSFQMGLDGFIWWIGVIENLNDTLRLGRAQVRILGWHNINDSVLPTIDLPWALPLHPITQSTQLPNFKHGDWVVGFFLDGKLAQQPVMIGVLPAIAQPQPK